MKKAILLIHLIFLVPAMKGAVLNTAITMRSTDGTITATVYTKDAKLFYTIKAGSQTLINNGSMGLVVDKVPYGTRVNNISLLGKNSIQKKSNTYTTYRISIREAGKKYNVEFCLSNKGAAFRYIFDAKVSHQVSGELTTFNLPKSKVWFFERNSSWKLKSYAGLWQSTTADSLNVVSSQGPIQGKPVLLELPDKKYAMLSEAALYNYSGMRFKALGNRVLQADYTEKDGFKVEGRLITPWRVLLHAPDLDALVNNTMINDLNPDADKVLYADKSYIKPGRSVWSWITRTENFMQPEEEKKFINAASELNFEYTLLDEGWETIWPEKWKQLADMCNYAAARKVSVWVWKNSKALRDPSARDAFLDSVRNAGVVGIKTDFMDSEAKELVDFEIGFLKACAKRKLMVNFHGCHAPTGESKTYPNEMTREGIRGMELNIMKEPIPAWHNAALPFTRMILGHGDYTPGLFYNKANTTYTHQLALFYLLNSPFQCLAENPVKLLADKRFKPVIPLLKTLPVTWDDTLVLPGSAIGELAAIAKRKGEVWYVAVINGTDQNKEFSLRPYFLQKTKKYTAIAISDAADGFLKDSSVLAATDDKKIVIGPNGGLLIEIKP